MAATKARVELNRKAFSEIELAEADGLFEIAKLVLRNADVPDAPPIRRGLIQGGGVIVYLGNRRVAVSQGGINKPRDLRLRPNQTAAAVGFGFPGRFVELGTVDTRAQPFLTEAVARTLPGADVTLSKTIRKKLGLSTGSMAAFRKG